MRSTPSPPPLPPTLTPHLHKILQEVPTPLPSPLTPSFLPRSHSMPLFKPMHYHTPSLHLSSIRSPSSSRPLPGILGSGASTTLTASTRASGNLAARRGKRGERKRRGGRGETTENLEAEPTEHGHPFLVPTHAAGRQASLHANNGWRAPLRLMRVPLFSRCQVDSLAIGMFVRVCVLLLYFSISASLDAGRDKAG